MTISNISSNFVSCHTQDIYIVDITSPHSISLVQWLDSFRICSRFFCDGEVSIPQHHDYAFPLFFLSDTCDLAQSSHIFDPCFPGQCVHILYQCDPPQQDCK